METRNIKVESVFRFNADGGPKGQGSDSWNTQVQSKIEEMQRLAETYNFNDRPVSLHFFGDSKSGLGVRVESPDPETKARITNALKLYLKNRP